MKPADVAHYRLLNQGIASPGFDGPGAVVRRLGALQAQDYLGSLWAIGLRHRRSTEAEVERAIADRAIVRTWPMRGTLHFVPAVDARWMLALCTPRVIAKSDRRYRELELDRTVFSRSRTLVERALGKGGPVPRTEIYRMLESAGISTADSRGLHILAHLAQEGTVCFGPRLGRQPTFVLLDQWVSTPRSLTREESLAELALRYFTGHGPATLADFTWWSGLAAAEARAALALVESRLTSDLVGDLVHWFAPPDRSPPRTGEAHLLPAFDEYLVGYRDRSAVVASSLAHRVNAGGGILNPTIVIAGRVAGTWSRALEANAVAVTAGPFARLTDRPAHALAGAAARYGEFLGLPATLTRSSRGPGTLGGSRRTRHGKRG